MSKRNKSDKSTYTFLSMGISHFSHGKITADVESKHIDGKEMTCPKCSHKYLWDKWFCLKPRYPKSYYKKKGLPYGFTVEMEINTPSADEKGGDPLPRISYVIRGCKIVIEDREHEFIPGEDEPVKDAVTLRCADKNLTMELFEMK
mgnify:FL=1